MALLTRRRFLSISAGFAALAARPMAARAGLTEWRGIALGAKAQILLDHPEADRLIDLALAEIARLEAIFSLNRPDTALVRLNATGRLEAPPFELLECLGLSGRVHGATGGLFDPSVQPLWELYARKAMAGLNPPPEEIAATLGRTGWDGVSFDAEAVVLRPGMALTLNGVAQGFIADKVARLLMDQGLSHVLVNTGEFRAAGPMPDGAPWPVQLTSGPVVPLSGGALASSSVLGTTFDEAGRIGHILDPRTGLPAQPRWQLVSVTAPSAGLADALSTAACLMPDRATIEAVLARFEGAGLAGLS